MRSQGLAAIALAAVAAGLVARPAPADDGLPDAGDADDPGVLPKVGLIVGGWDAAPGEFPFVAAVLDAGDDGSVIDRQFCAGVVVHARWILTAAHCVVDRFPSELEVFVGSGDLGRPEDGRRIRVVDIVAHPDFDPLTSDSDLALLLLAEPVPGKAVPVALNRGQADDGAGVPGLILGWGASTDGGEPVTARLQAAEVPLVENAAAEVIYGQVTENMLFAGHAGGGPNTCTGDSGGPLLVKDRKGGWALAGITSFGRDDVACAAPENYGGYTRVRRFASWVRRKIAPVTAAWEDHFEANADDFDSDGDGTCNRIEMAWGGDPWRPGDGPPLRPVRVRWGGEEFAALRFLRPEGRSEIECRVEFSAGLGDWQPLDPADFGVGPAQPAEPSTDGVAREWMTVRSPASAGSPDGRQGFFRVVVESTDRYVPSLRRLAFPGFVRTALHQEDQPPPGAGLLCEKWFLVDGVADEPEIELVLNAPAFRGRLDVHDAGSRELLGSATPSDDAPCHVRLRIRPLGRAALLVRVAGDRETECGDFLFTASRPLDDDPVIRLGESREGKLTSDDPIDPEYLPEEYHVDAFRLTDIPAGTHVTLTLVSDAFDAFLVLADAMTGEVLQVDDDSAGYDGWDDAPGLDAYIGFVMPEDRELVVRVTSAGERETGAYRLEVGRGAILEPGVTIDGALERSDPLDAHEDPADPAEPHGDGGPRFRDDYLLAGAEAGVVMRVEVAARGFGIDVVLEILDGVTGRLLLAIDEEGRSQRESVAFVPKEGRFYVARVTSAGRRETGNYEIAWQQR